MATLTELRARRDRLIAAQASGNRVVQAGDKRIEKFGPGELDEAIRRIDREIAAAGGSGVRRRLKPIMVKDL